MTNWRLQHPRKLSKLKYFIYLKKWEICGERKEREKKTKLGGWILKQSKNIDLFILHVFQTQYKVAILMVSLNFGSDFRQNEKRKVDLNCPKPNQRYLTLRLKIHSMFLKCRRKEANRHSGTIAITKTQRFCFRCFSRYGYL